MTGGAFRRGAAAWLLIPALAAAGPGEPAGDPAALRKEAVARYREGRYDEAIGLFKRLAKSTPQDDKVVRDLMWALWRVEKYAEAAEEAARLKALKPGDKDAERVLAQAPALLSQKDFNAKREKAVGHYRAGRYEEAAGLYRELAALQPGDVKIRKDLMWSLWQAGRMEEAEQAAAAVTDAGPADEEVWNLRGDALLGLGRKKEAAVFYEKSLERSPRQPRILMALARLYEEGRDDARAAEALERVKRLNPGNRQVYAPLARIQYGAGQYAASAENWRQAARFFPQRRDYVLNEARALYHAGSLPAALSRMKALAAAGSREAADFLIDDAWAAENWDAAGDLLEKHKGAPTPENEARWMKQLALAKTRWKPEEFRALLEEFLDANPRHDRALMMKAQLLADAEDWVGASKIYKDILSWNPWHKAAMGKLADAHAQAGALAQAAAIVARMRWLDPTDPSLVILQERYMHEGVDRAAARNLLLAWLENNEEPALPILLYHGLAASRRDPMLAHPVHMTAAAFESHMRAVKAAGYTPVTAAQVNDWIHRKGALPPRPILITFDDGRMDSFRHADPVLKKYGLKATMYSCLVNLEGHRPIYAPWSVQQAHVRTGRWEIESHGDMAHTRVPAGPGRAGLFLLNRQWDQASGKLESEADWKARVTRDHEESKQKIRDNVGTLPVSFAFPEGDYGHQSVPNSPDSADVNLALVRRSYGFALHQDEFGVNVRSRNPMLLARLEPNRDWSGEQLVEYLRAADPFTRVYRSLLKQALWRGNTHEAARWLKVLRRRGAPEAIVSAEEGRIRFHTGDTAGGYDLTRRALEKSRDPETTNLVSSMEERGGAGWRPTAAWQEDEEGRESRSFRQTLDVPLRSGRRWTLEHRWVEYRDEDGLDPLRLHGGGLRFRQPLGLFHALTVGGMGYKVSDDLGDDHELAARLTSSWTDSFSTEAEGERSLYDTARALRADVRQDHGGLLLRWTPDSGRWRASARGRYAKLTDGNRRRTGQADLARVLDPRSRWRVLARYIYDDMRDVSPAYYSPRGLNEGLGGLEYVSSGKKGDLYARYLAGSGREEAGDPVFVQEFEMEARLPLGPRTFLGPTALLSRSPRYWRRTFGLALHHRFGA